MDELATKLVDSLTKVENALETMAPGAFEALTSAAYVTGMVTLGTGFLCLVALPFTLLLFYHGVNNSNKWNDGIVGVSVGVGAIGSLMLFLFMTFRLLDSTTWLKVLDPTAYVVRTLLSQ